MEKHAPCMLPRERLEAETAAPNRQLARSAIGNPVQEKQAGASFRANGQPGSRGRGGQGGLNRLNFWTGVSYWLIVASISWLALEWEWCRGASVGKWKILWQSAANHEKKNIKLPLFAIHLQTSNTKHVFEHIHCTLHFTCQIKSRCPIKEGLASAATIRSEAPIRMILSSVLTGELIFKIAKHSMSNLWKVILFSHYLPDNTRNSRCIQCRTWLGKSWEHILSQIPPTRCFLFYFSASDCGLCRCPVGIYKTFKRLNPALQFVD